jgi:IPT/TIG domain
MPEIQLPDSSAFARWSVPNIPGPRQFERRIRIAGAAGALLAAAVLLAIPTRPLAAQASPRVAAVDPASGKPNDTVTVSGEMLEKSHVSAVFLSDDKDDHKAIVVSQAADKITIKIPEVKPGDYNVSIQSGNAIFIQPVHFIVQ